jgi:hypothetical protein
LAISSASIATCSSPTSWIRSGSQSLAGVHADGLAVEGLAARVLREPDLLGCCRDVVVVEQRQHGVEGRHDLVGHQRLDAAAEPGGVGARQRREPRVGHREDRGRGVAVAAQGLADSGQRRAREQDAALALAEQLAAQLGDEDAVVAEQGEVAVDVGRGREREAAEHVAHGERQEERRVRRAAEPVPVQLGRPHPPVEQEAQEAGGHEVVRRRGRRVDGVERCQHPGRERCLALGVLEGPRGQLLHQEAATHPQVGLAGQPVLPDLLRDVLHRRAAHGAPLLGCRDRRPGAVPPRRPPVDADVDRLRQPSSRSCRGGAGG